MTRLVILSATEQVAAYLRGELQAGKWSGLMPGGDRLALELGAGRDTVEAALKQLEAEGWLINQGRRRGRLIVPQAGVITPRGIRVAILTFSREDRGLDYLLKMEHQLAKEGHEVVFAPMSLTDLGMNVGRVERLVERTQAHAWVVLAGSREVLEWFAMRDIPVMAIFGRRRSLPIAGVGPDKIPAIREATRALIGLGHKRIVLLTRPMNCRPEPAAGVRAFLDELEAHGITPGPYHLPELEDSVTGLNTRLKSLFRLTPPTAMIIDEAPFYVAVQHFLGRLRMAVPEDASLISLDDDPAFAWCKPEVSHIRWDRDAVVRRVSQWLSNIRKGNKDVRQTTATAVFIPGATIGPAKHK
jgi:DNA-binding LacI/PurR family transcriptional regulator/biotin operon repressor